MPQPVHCDLRRLTCKAQKHSINKEEKKVTWNPQLHLRTQIEPTSTAKHRRQSPSRTRANFSLQRNVHFPKKTQCVLQFLTFKSHPSCSSSSAIAKDDLQNTSRIARHYYPWISLAATSPLRPAQTDLQNTKAQHQQRREKVTWNPPLHCTHFSSRIRQSDDAKARRAREPTVLRNVTSVSPRRHHVSCNS